MDAIFAGAKQPEPKKRRASLAKADASVLG